MTTEADTPKLDVKSVPPGPYIRSHNRFEVVIDLGLQVLIPEDTFQPQRLNGNTVDVSARGMQVDVANLDIELYTKLIARTRHVRVAFSDSGGETEIKLTGRIAWIDYRKTKASQKTGPCRIGIFFDDQEGIDLTQYTHFIDQLAAA